MDITQIKKPLNQFLTEVSKSITVDQMIIFGSYAEGKATEDSDIDVLVVSDDFKKVKVENRLSILDRAAGTIEPEVQSWGVTNKELETASHLNLLGYAREHGVKFLK